MLLLDCPRCRGYTPVDDDATKAACRWCRLGIGAVDQHVVRDPQRVRHFVLEDLQLMAGLMLTFGIGQAVIALLYFTVFLVVGGVRAGSDDLLQIAMLIALAVVLFAGGVFIIAGSQAVIRGRWRLMAVVGAIFTLTSPLLLGLPIGVWALRRLSRPEVRAAFAMSTGRSES